jgi:uncharacterized protein (DUF1501 family)
MTQALPIVTWRDDPAHFRASRRDFVQVGVVGGLGLTLGQFFHLRQSWAGEDAAAAETTKKATAKSVIHIFLPGGISHQETFDPKPNAPIDYRGEMGSIDTKISGVRFNELLKQTAQIADQITVCRSMTHGEAAHERGTANMFTGYRPSPALVYPSWGSVVSHEFGPRENLPPYVNIPNQAAIDAGSGYLSSSYGPFSLGADPGDKNFSVRDLNLSGGVDDARFDSRRSMLEIVNGHFPALEKSDKLAAMDTFYDRAYSLISSQKAREAFNIKAEPNELRDQYGRNAAGQRMLLARRLVESGVRFVTLTYGGWDHHAQVKAGVSGQLPAFDQAFATLIRDLDKRGLLDSTLVMVSSEFGRTPKVNRDGGRDHWPKVFSIVLAGGGIKRGSIYGTSDATAAEPEDDPLTLSDLAATLYHCLGIDGEKRLMAPGNRPVRIVDNGKLRQELLA